MRPSLVLPLLLAGALSTAGAQRPRVRVVPTPAPTPAPDAPFVSGFAFARDDDPHAVIGVTTSSAASARDTLGVLVTSVVEGSPAEKAGIEEGNRIAAVNEVSLRLASADIGAGEMSGAMQRRLTRVLRAVKPGDDVQLTIYSAGRMRTVTVRTVSSDELYPSRRRMDSDDRASLGFGVASTGSRRDTLGVLVMFVADSGPAARAGIEEGNRIASINGVDLRVDQADAGDAIIASARARRLQRELERVKPGDDVDLRVYRNGTFQTMRLRAVRASDLPRSGGSMIFMGGDTRLPSMITLPRTGGRSLSPLLMQLDGTVMREEVRRALERAMDAAGASLEGAGRALDGVGRGLGRTRLQWDDDDAGVIRDERSAPRVRRSTAPRPIYRSAELVPLEAPTPTVELAPVTELTRTLDALSSVELTRTLDALSSPEMALAASWSETPMVETDDATLTFAGLELALVDRELAEYLGAGSENGLLVVRVPGWATSLRAGDVILSIDGVPVRRGAETTLSLARGASVELLRRGARTTVKLPEPR